MQVIIFPIYFSFFSLTQLSLKGLLTQLSLSFKELIGSHVDFLIITWAQGSLSLSLPPIIVVIV